MNELRIGVSGWSYKEWRGVFYPAGLTHKRELEFAGSHFNSIEINASFYRLQTPASYKNWHDATPDDFLFALKGSKFITHQKKLEDARIPLANFFASGPLLLGRKLGPILWQFSPWFRFDAEKIEAFIKLLPRTSKEAAKLARKNTIQLPKNAWTESIADVELRYAFEPRHKSFFTPEFIELLAKNNAAITFADTADKFGYTEDVTADFVYVRLHGGDELYVSDYRDVELDRWAKRIKVWRKGGEPGDARKVVGGRPPIKQARDVFVYFDNSIEGHAAFDAIDLARKLGIKGKGPAR